MRADANLLFYLLKIFFMELLFQKNFFPYLCDP